MALNYSDYNMPCCLFSAGTAGDMETSGRLNIGGPHKGQRFSTKDRDWDDNDSDNCAGRTFIFEKFLLYI